MLGWLISVYRFGEHELRAVRGDAEAILAALSNEGAEVDPVQGQRLAVWQAGSSGLDWIDQIIEERQGVCLLQGGYPNRYVVRARDLAQLIRRGLPEVHDYWVCGPDDILLPGYLGKTTIDEEALRACASDEWLLIEVWDES